MTETRLKPLRGDGAKLLKLVLEANDASTLEQALELGAAIGQPAEGLLDGIEVTAAGELLPSSRFRGTQASQGALDLLLVHQLSLAPEGTPQAALRRAVRRLVLACPILPTLKGFDGLEVLAVTVPAGAQWEGLSAWGPMPSLETLVIDSAGTKERPASLMSLTGMHAPALTEARLAGLGLASIEGLNACTRLSRVDLSQNATLTGIGALAASAATLTELLLEGCAQVDSLEALAGATALTTLNLKGCARVPSLRPLSDSRLLASLDLEGCARLESLEGLSGSDVSPIRYSFFDLTGCASLKSLRGLPTLHEDTTSLYLQSMPALASLEGIEAARSVTSVTIDGAALKNLDGLGSLLQLEEVRVFDCKALEDVRALGKLPRLERAKVRSSPALKLLPDAWGESLKGLELSEGTFTALGQLPAGLEDLEVREVASLTNLRGAETATALKEVSVDTNLRDASALAGLPHACLRCFNAPRVDVTPAWVQSVVREVKPLRLDLRFTSLTDLQFLLDLPQLEQLYLDQDACEVYGLKGSEHLTESAVRTVQRAIAKKHQLPVPDYLKPRRVSKQSATAGGPSLADIKRGLTSTDFTQVVAALDALRTSGDASLYDALFDGVHGPTMYTGDTAPLGKMFRDIRAPQRPWARWALTHALMEAPADCASAQALCKSIDAIHLSVSPVKGRNAPGPLALDRFTALKSFTLTGTDDEDLGFLARLGPVESLSLIALHRLKSLAGLASSVALPHLKTLKLERCGALQSLQGLEGATQLTMISASDCEALSDFTAMAGLPALTVFPGWSLRSGSINLTGHAPQSQVDFVAGLKAAESLSLKLHGRVDLSAVARLPGLRSLELDVDTLDQDFSPLAGLRELEIRLIDPKDGYSRSVKGEPKPGERHVWQGSFPVLESLVLHGGAHELEQIEAPALTTFEGHCQLSSLRGVGHASTLKFNVQSCKSLDGLAGSPVTELSLHYFDPKGAKLPSFALVHEVPGLRKIQIGQSLTERHAKELTGCAQVQALQAYGYSGSLAFLAGWTQLAEIDLRNSGTLTDLETLCDLPSLTLVRLKGAAMKREAWPKALQDRLDFRSS